MGRGRGYGDAEIQLIEFLTSELDGYKWSASSSGLVTAVRKVSQVNFECDIFGERTHVRS
jgi:hypothetical protein